MIDFIKEVTWKEAHKFMEELDKDYIATKGFLQRSDDGVFVRLIKDGKKAK